MNFIIQPAFWLLVAVCLAISSIPSFMRSIGMKKLTFIAIPWASACGATYILYGAHPAILSAASSAVWGILLLTASLIRTGVKSMPNNRFENR